MGENVGYQVLARKWRPRNFQQMVGQTHVLQALTNALTHNRLHHAYLFTGTRGVGKTTIARIFAKSLNCQMGVTATPCGECSHCQQIDAGRFVDLIEIDAASRTKVEDTRELLDSVPYAPHSGRYKVYVIDEVHMLSGHSFNALLKTLEEPPQHSKFLLATTDPQKIPITVLSRCLQFHLRHLSRTEITDYLAHIATQEKITYELPALIQLAKAANGSLRDALSLLDQAIAFSDHNLTQEQMHHMLGSIQAIYFDRLVDALCSKNATQVFAAIDEIAVYTSDFSGVLAELLSILHQIALKQSIPQLAQDVTDEAKLTQWATALTQEEVQLFYQIALIGRRDLPLAPSAKTGFEMVLLRLLFFSPVTVEPMQETTKALTSPTTSMSVQADIQGSHIVSEEIPNTVSSHAAYSPVSELSLKKSTLSQPDTLPWAEVLASLNLTGITKTLAAHSVCKAITPTTITLILDENQALFLNEKQRERLEQALNQFYGTPRKLVIALEKITTLSPAAEQKQQQTAKQTTAFNELQQDANIQTILQTFGTTLAIENVRAYSPTNQEIPRGL